MSKNSARILAEKKGRRAENWASIWLQFKGYRILERRYKTKSGEIDLIARRGKTVAIVEVKRRDTLIAAHESLNPRSLTRIENAADQFISSRPQYADCHIRFDAIFVLDGFRIKHIIDAWRAY